MQRVLFLNEVAEEYRIPAATLRWMRHVGRGPKSWKRGRRVCYLREDVDAWVEAEYASTVRGA